MIKKSYIKTRKTCKITFQIPGRELPEDIEIESVSVVGDFNDWDPDANPMTHYKSGHYKAQVEVEPGQEVQFRYLANGEYWFNAWDADAYTPNHLGTEDCVVIAAAPEE